MNESVSAFILGTCRLLPKSSTDVFEFLYRQSLTSCDTYEIPCGSSAEFYIQPIRSCIGDTDCLWLTPNSLAFANRKCKFAFDARACADLADCFLIESCHDYPAYVKLRKVEQIKFNWDQKILLCLSLKAEDRILLATRDMCYRDTYHMN